MEELFTPAWVDAQVAHSIELWNDCAAQPAPNCTSIRPQFAPRFSPDDQQRREDAYDEALQSVEREARRMPRSKADRVAGQARIVNAFPRFAAIALGLDGPAIHLLTDNFLPVGTQLARRAREFDAGISTADMIQACRNAWTACGLQPLLGEPMGMTPSILGYSLLYPYSDNYLDSAEITSADKLRFSARFRQRLQGHTLQPRNPHESAVWALVQLIEDQYPRPRHPQVFDSLLAIHAAQEKSMAQLGKYRLDSSGLSASGLSEILRISCAKGGTSVLADACLAHGNLNQEQSRFAFAWGVLLQLGDDLQDVADDVRRGSVTLFSHAVSMRQPLDSLVLQLLNLSDRVAAQMDRQPHGDASLKGLLRMSWRSLILMAVADAHTFFTPQFLAEHERGSSFRFDFLRARRQRLSGRRGLYEIVFNAFLEADAESSVPNQLPRPTEEPSLAVMRA